MKMTSFMLRSVCASSLRSYMLIAASVGWISNWAIIMACHRSAGRHRRHILENHFIFRVIRWIDIDAELEPSRLLHGNGKRPDEAMLDPWHSEKYLHWDFTCPDTLAPSHLSQSSLAAGSAAVSEESRKRSKYVEFVESENYIFFRSQWKLSGLRDHPHWSSVPTSWVERRQ
jgi:hypothetical protein